MSKGRRLVLEVLSGPLDGATITLQDETELRRVGTGPLIFPWDGELGEPQARVTAEEDGWWLEGSPAPHGTYRVNREERIEDKIQLDTGDILKASQVWLLVREIE